LTQQQQQQQQQELLLLLSTRRKVPGTILAASRRQFGVASFVFGGDSPPEEARADWEIGLELTKGGKAGEAEVAFHRALTAIDSSGYAPRSGQGRATVAAMWRDLARAQSMQSKTHEALHNLRRSLAVYDGLDHSTELLEVAQHWQKQSGVTGRLAKEMPRMPDGVPVDLLLNILDNLVVRFSREHSVAHVAIASSDPVASSRNYAEPLCTAARRYRTFSPNSACST
jgi:hypothetical protein